MTGITFTQTHPDEPTLVALVYLLDAGSYNVPVPAGANWLRASAGGCGGQGDHWGGSGARARSTRTVTPADNLLCQVGQVNTQTTNGDSFVKRNDGTVIVYADRGRGDGTRGTASNSFGDFTFDGADGSVGGGGLPPSDAGDVYSLGFGGHAPSSSNIQAADAGAGGLVATSTDENGVGLVPGTFGAGPGMLVLEFFDTNPGV
jgi:hypothetical protein